MPLRVTLLAIRSATRAADYDAAVDEYLRRCGKAMPAASKTLRSEDAVLELCAEERKRESAQLWLADLGGTALTSEKFAERVGAVRDNGVRHLLLAIGPADGWSAKARSVAELRISLGAMTLPHELARLLLAEQIYRASTILAGHPYHLGH